MGGEGEDGLLVGTAWIKGVSGHAVFKLRNGLRAVIRKRKSIKEGERSARHEQADRGICELLISRCRMDYQSAMVAAAGASDVSV